MRFPGESVSLGQRFEDLVRKEDLARRGQAALWAAILDEYQSLLTAHGDELLPLSPHHSLQARRVCASRLSRLPAHVLERHRGRVEATARHWLEEGQRLRDARLLRRVAEEAFCSDAAGASLELLGDLAFENGNLEEADQWWRLLAPPPGEAPQIAGLGLLYPGGPARQASAQARQLLVRWFQGEATQPMAWRRDLERFRKQHPDTVGHLAGQKGILWKRLEEVATRGPREALDPPWTTYAGSSTRNRLQTATALRPEGLARLIRDGQSYRLPLLGDLPEEAGPVLRPGEAARSLTFCPVLSEGFALLADSRYVTAVDLKTGKREPWLDAARLNGAAAEHRVPPPDLRCTLTVADDCVLVRLGVSAVRSGRADRETLKEGASFLACLELQPSGKGERLRWQAAADPKSRGVFEGSPVVNNGQAFVAVTRFEANRAITAIHCYPLQARGEASPRWKSDVCQTREPDSGEIRHRHHLLTVAGNQLVYCSHSGAVVAVDALTGKTTWGLRYRQARIVEDPTRPAGPRDVNPCVYAAGRLLVAPADSDVLLCIDPVTGQMIWERDAIEVLHLLGVGQGRVIFTTRTPKPGLRAVKLADGGDRGGWFRTAPSGPLHSFGRGLLTDDLVLWPTLQHVFAVRQEDGELPDDPTLTHRVPPGNLAFGCGTLAVTDRTHLHLFPPPRLKLEERKKDAKRNPFSSSANFRLGIALADAQRFEEAADAFRAAGRLTGAERRQTCIEEEHRVLLEHAEHLLRAGERENAVTVFAGASSKEFPSGLRRTALAQSARAWKTVGDSDRAKAACEALLRDPELFGGHLLDERGNPQATRRWAADVLAELGLPTKEERLTLRLPTPALALPLVRAWHRPPLPGARMLFPESCDFERQVERFFVLEQGRLLESHDAETGKKQWQRQLPIPVTRVLHHAGPVFAAGPEGLVSVHPADGRVLWEYPAPQRPAGQATSLSEFRLKGDALSCVQGRSHLYRLHAHAGRVTSTQRGDVRSSGLLIERTEPERFRDLLGNPTTLSGEPLERIALSEGSEFLVVPRNHGTTLERFDRGKPAWAAPPLFARGLWPGSVSHDADAFFLVDDRELRACRLDTGRPIWTRPLPGAAERWQTLRKGDWLVAWPVQRQSRSIPVPLTAGRLEWKLFWSREDSFPVLLCEARTGQLVQQLHLPAFPPRIRCNAEDDGRPEVRLTPTGLLIRAGDGLHFLKTMSDN